MIVELDRPPILPVPPLRLIAAPAAAYVATLAVVLALAVPGAPSVALPAPCGDAPDAVVRTFFDRLGSDPTRVGECWADGALDGNALSSYASSTPPHSLALGHVHLGRYGTVMLAGYPVWARWSAQAPLGFANDGSWRWLLLRREGGRWAIFEVQIPR